MLEEQEEAFCSNPHRAQSVALAKPVKAHDATVGGTVAALMRQQEHKKAPLRTRLLERYRALTEDVKEGGSPMPIVVGADGVGVRMERAETYRIVEVGDEVAEGMRLGETGMGVV